jgi:hypothetical protein
LPYGLLRALNPLRQKIQHNAADADQAKINLLNFCHLQSKTEARESTPGSSIAIESVWAG